jgi:hypothetical protein
MGVQPALVLLQQSTSVARAEPEGVPRARRGLRHRHEDAVLDARKVGEGSGTSTDMPLVQEQCCPMPPQMIASWWVREAAG